MAEVRRLLRDGPHTLADAAPASLHHEAQPDSASLVARIHAREPCAEDELVRRYRSGLIAMLRHWTGNRVLAEDLAHEALVVTIERLRERPLDEPSKLGAFLRGTAHNLAIASDRRDARQRTAAVGEQIDYYIDDAADPAALTERAQEAALVRKLIAELPVERDRELLNRYYVAGESKGRLCDELGLEAVHFNRVLHRARRRLRELLNQLGEGG